MSLKTLWGALCDCFVPKSGGGVLTGKTVYGRRATELSLAEVSNTGQVTIQSALPYTATSDCLVSLLWSRDSNDIGCYVGITVNNVTEQLITNSYGTHYVTSILLKKGDVLNVGSTFNYLYRYLYVYQIN